MVKNQYISFILLLILVVTIVNLFYKHRLSAPYKTLSDLKTLLHPITKAVCPLHGFKCPTEQLCDCNKYCSNGESFSPFRIRRDMERMYVMNEKLSPGSYCLPTGFETCDMKTSIPVFSLAGWSCLPLDHALFRDGKAIACQNEEAAHPNLNVLWNYGNNRPAVVEDIKDYYEPLSSGRLRYGCRCASKSLDGTPMLSVLPFTCSVDYCLRDILNPLTEMGFNGRTCECGFYNHLDKDDPATPCVSEKSRIIDTYDTFLGRIDCMDPYSFIKKPLFCPADEKHATFRVTVNGTNAITDILRMLVERDLKGHVEES